MALSYETYIAALYFIVSKPSSFVLHLRFRIKTIEDAKIMICRRQRWTGVVKVNASIPYNDPGVHEKEYLLYIPEGLADVSDNTFLRMTAEVEAAQSALLPRRV
ncbi:hypothetical protein K440DRAFT_644005 [Wilcoxina mikolae CBS 423.85]|nr:hypothetical protein K440DRAFT_644005 [Wilcoxina mikolae CBS 423.85]